MPRKSDLIKMLESIEGDPEIVVWNGFVDDWQSIDTDIEQIELVKHSRQFMRSIINSERNQAGKKPLSDKELDSIMRKQTWDLPNCQLENMERWYGSRRKKIVALSLKSRGKTSWGRDTTLKY